MKKIITTTLLSGLVALSVANAASAGERHHARRQVQSPAVTTTDPRDSFAEFGFARGPANYGYGNVDGRVYGGHHRSACRALIERNRCVERAGPAGPAFFVGAAVARVEPLRNPGSLGARGAPGYAKALHPGYEGLDKG